MQLKLTANLDSADAQDEDGQPCGPAIAGYLRDVADRIENGSREGRIRDTVHSIGAYKITGR
jgi:hypothetical protein